MSRKGINAIKEYHLNAHQPTKPQFAMYDLQNYLQKHGENASKAHIHSYYQIIWFKKGNGRHFVDFKQYDVIDNSIFFIARDQVHYFDEGTDYEGILLHFNESFIIQKDSEVEFFLKCSLFNNPYQIPSCCIGDHIVVTLDLYLNLMQQELANNEENTDHFGREELLRLYLKSFLIQVQRRKNEFELNNSDFPFHTDEKRMQLMRFINLIDENYKKGLPVSEYASIMNFSSRTLSDLTNNFLNKTPSQMIQERMILEAQRMLLHSDLNISQIADHLGFEDPSYFVKYFKKHVQQSPSDFKKSIL
ncbi:helix-turn-helix domain-containing protein [Chryseobacterium aquifrigidense]|uniref:AraC-like DNA-binding protein n=1 Tax=Chryseobacterium aquifrigidense TaxID=558021 RepID=A0A543EHL3_9FLAO|nr:AraC family transcriptional regulator [Chryseobacterium aquifrigidense]TQM21077.1 AraC-like DNA-binding protein [Chryseobacterium aquifrigidense]